MGGTGGIDQHPDHNDSREIYDQFGFSGDLLNGHLNRRSQSKPNRTSAGPYNSVPTGN
jgi:hypothetical protein